jgi:hypothetical protein
LYFFLRIKNKKKNGEKEEKAQRKKLLFLSLEQDRTQEVNKQTSLV